MQQQFIRLSQLATTQDKPGLIPASPATVWRWVRANTFPKPVKLGSRITAWRAADIQKWMEQQGGANA